MINHVYYYTRVFIHFICILTEINSINYYYIVFIYIGFIIIIPLLIYSILFHSPYQLDYSEFFIWEVWINKVNKNLLQ